jgi:hypothetical protein
MPKVRFSRPLHFQELDDDVIVLWTTAKIGEFTCSEASLFDNLSAAVRGADHCTTTTLAVRPYVTVIVRSGAGALDSKRAALSKVVKETLRYWHDGGARYLQR